MSRAVRFAAVALPAVAVLLLALSTDRSPTDPEPLGRPVVAEALSVPTTQDGASVRRRSPLAVARRALRWLLAAETGEVRPLPAATFARPLARDLRARHPRPAPGRARARVVGLREQARLGPLRRVLADIERSRRHEHVTLLVACRHACLVAAVE